MVETRSRARASGATPGQDSLQNIKSWAETHGVGDHSGAWGLTGAAGIALAYAGALLLMVGCPAFAIYMCAPEFPPEFSRQRFNNKCLS